MLSFWKELRIRIHTHKKRVIESVHPVEDLKNDSYDPAYAREP